MLEAQEDVLSQPPQKKKRQVMVTPMVERMYADVMLSLGNGKYLCMGIINGKPLMRFHDLTHTDNEGRPYRYVNLNIKQWLDFLANAPHIMGAIQTISDHSYLRSENHFDLVDVEARENGVYPTCAGSTLKIHLGKNVHIVCKPGAKYIHIRRYFLAPEDCADLSVPHDEFQLTPTKDGIVLTFAEWNKLMDFIPLTQLILGDCKELSRCKDYHERERVNPLECDHCNPNGYSYWLSIKTQAEEKLRQKEVEEESILLQQQKDETVDAEDIDQSQASKQKPSKLKRSISKKNVC